MNTRARGFTLVESLVALVLLSLGLLGAWSLLMSSLRGHAEARHRAAATNLVRDLADRIRANPAAGALYTARDQETVSCDAPSPCDVAQRAAADLAQFTQAANSLLPGAATIVEFEPAIGSAAADRYAITLRWRGLRDEESVTLQMLAAPVAG